MFHHVFGRRMADHGHADRGGDRPLHAAAVHLALVQQFAGSCRPAGTGSPTARPTTSGPGGRPRCAPARRCHAGACPAQRRFPPSRRSPACAPAFVTIALEAVDVDVEQGRVAAWSRRHNSSCATRWVKWRALTRPVRRSWVSSQRRLSRSCARRCRGTPPPSPRAGSGWPMAAAPSIRPARHCRPCARTPRLVALQGVAVDIGLAGADSRRQRRAILGGVVQHLVRGARPATLPRHSRAGAGRWD